MLKPVRLLSIAADGMSIRPGTLGVPRPVTASQPLPALKPGTVIGAPYNNIAKASSRADREVLGSSESVPCRLGCSYDIRRVLLAVVLHAVTW
jgi:hypothetical protein